MPSDYDKIREDNILEYGRGTRHLSFLGRLYIDRTHFLFELLQNAEDAGASRIFFRVLQDRLEVQHDGRPFNESDVRGLCGVGEGTKSEDLTQIGKFGIGFKSVYAYTSSPEIHSGDERFRIDNYVRPYGMEPRKIGESWTTLFIFKFDAETIDQETARREIAKRLRNLSARTLMFLRKIRRIEYKIEHLPDGFYERRDSVRGLARQVTIIGKNNVKDEDENWLIFERPVPVPDGSYNVRIELAFRLEFNRKSKGENIIAIRDAPLVVYFPTEKSTRFGFMIQGPYRTTPSRDNIPRDDPWNLTLVDETANLLTDVLPSLKEMGLLSVTFLETLPIRMEDFPEDGMFYPIVDAVRSVLQSESLLPADDGAFVSARNAKLARGADLRDILSHEQLSSLFQSQNTVKWLIGNITQDRTPDLRNYLISELHIEEITPDTLARKLTYEFIANQTDDWFIKFYSYLSGQEALWRAPRWAGDTGGLLRAKAILRLQDNRLVAPFQLDGTTPNAFLPPPEETDFPVVKRSLAANEQARDFLTRLKLSEPNIFDDIVDRLLPKYSEGNVSSIPESEHAIDIQKVFRALNSDSEAGKKKVMQAARRTSFLRAADPTGKLSYKKPNDIYQESPELDLYFSGLTDIWYLSERSLSSTDSSGILSELGVESKPRFLLVQADLSCEEKSRLRGNQNFTRDIRAVDYDLHGLDNFLSTFPTDYNRAKSYSLTLWKFLLTHLKNSSYYNFYEGQYKWFYYSERTACFDAVWKKRLLNHLWLPDADGNALHRPVEISLNELPDEFERNEKLGLLLGLKKDIVQDLAKEAGVRIETIEIARELEGNPGLLQYVQEKLTEAKIGLEFPTGTLPNPERREEKLYQAIVEAPKKVYEERPRQVRVSKRLIDPSTWLRAKYRNENGQMFCQICLKVMPFKKPDDNEYYFEAIEITNESDIEHEELYIALCPTCAAKYKVFIKNYKEKIREVTTSILNTTKREIPIKLDTPGASIKFRRDHLSDLKKILSQNRPNLGDQIDNLKVEPVPLSVDPRKREKLSGDIKPTPEIIYKKGASRISEPPKTLIKCPYCQVTVRLDRLQRHIRKAHPDTKTTRTYEAVNNSFNAPRVVSSAKNSKRSGKVPKGFGPGRCRSCGAPVVPGSDYCYSCGG